MALRIVNTDAPLPPDLLEQAANLPAGAPVIVMIHGFRFAPTHPTACPHRHILSLTPDLPGPRVRSWPEGLGFSHDSLTDGLAIAYGWPALGKLRQAYGRAGMAGRGLATLVQNLAQASGRPVALIGHSLGARVALTAIRHAAPGSINRAILLTGAEFQDRARMALRPDGPEILNITTRENDPFDFGFELWLTRGRLHRRSIGAGLARPHPRWLDMQIDDGQTRAALRRLGFGIGWRDQLASHWSPYLHPGIFELYRSFLRSPQLMPLGLLAATLPEQQEPRWSRLRRLARPAWGWRHSSGVSA
ncbi:MAG: alpha/beta fold hydrolase [Paracoccus sp. (in: a-proteobacteria)]|uniref:alpha/beta fold hydrolase n=1 Tax=Paracoccus sp. TaxID=267 RepID=UPI0026E00B7B|nr:alpha/beta fold hydrolase [Paracoccus sp. (in: a-proteobacteria)]MDO5620130.1 alpha/beta fold hydrolase [Paracoccus sp. (in: a-proteobacteria)]